ncbi:MAG: glycosyltransferase family 4 protein [Pseudomonadales bacterium]|nr:glycosyltransferase family 4 protein [Pseudomonadales bacterium]
MRLLLLSTEFPPGPGGIGTHAHQLALNLHRLGWEIVVMTSQDYTTAAEIAAFNQAQPFEVIHLTSAAGAVRRLWERRQLISRKINEWQPDVIIGSGSRQAWMAALLAKFHRKACVVIGHGTEFGFNNYWKKRITQWAFEAATAVICVSQYTANYMYGVGIHARRVIVIPNGADISRFKQLSSEVLTDFRQEKQLPDGFLLLTVGNVTERKGQDVVIRALPHILKQVPDTHYLIAGLPTKRDEFLAIARELGVESHVHFLGRVVADDLLKYLNVCDIFVMTSKHTAEGDFEGYGIAVVEAALCGKPAVVADNSGLAEAIIPHETGLLAKQNDPVSTAEAIITLLNDATKRRVMGEAAYSYASTEQTWEHRVAEYHRLLTELAQGSSS